MILLKLSGHSLVDFMNRETIKSGILPGLVATLCCLGPLVLIMLGLISASTALSFTVYREWFLALSFVLLVSTVWFYLKKRRQIICAGCTTKSQERQRIAAFVFFSATTTLLVYVLVFYVVLPWLAPVVFENFYRGNR